MNGVLVGTSVWVDHFRNRNENLVSLLTLDLALSHPLIVTELACGTPPAPRSRTLTDIATLPQARQATLDEVRGFHRARKAVRPRMWCGRPGAVGVDAAHARIAFVVTGQAFARVGATVRRCLSARASIA